MGLPLHHVTKLTGIPEAVESRWTGKVKASLDIDRLSAYVECETTELREVCQWLFSEYEYSLATLVIEEEGSGWLLRYIFYGDPGSGMVHLLVPLARPQRVIPSISLQVHAADWHEREAEDLFGLIFEEHPKLGDFVLHEEWPEGVNPMGREFDSSRIYPHRQIDSTWRPPRIVQNPGAFAMPIGPVYSDYAESAHFLLETVGEDVIRTIPRFFYKYRGVEKIAEGRRPEDVLLLAERFSGTSAFAHSLAFCQAVEEISGVEVPARAKALRVLLAELERLRHHLHAIASLCASTALAVATSQASILEEEVLRLSCRLSGHRYLFGLNVPGGLALDFGDEECGRVREVTQGVLRRLRKLQDMLRFSSSFLDRLEEVGIVSRPAAQSYGLVGPVARASGIDRDLRRALPYSGYEKWDFTVPCEQEGDGYARLRILFSEAEQSIRIMDGVASSLPGGPVRCPSFPVRPGSALGWVEAPRGAAFHWLSLGEEAKVRRYRLTTPSFTNWHGFHLAAEEFAFQDFPIIMASFGLSNAESDR
jgi:formate hydrogenlyase subunit 5